MSPWEDISTEQLQEDISIDQQHPPLLAALTALTSVGQSMPPRRVGVSHFIRSTLRLSEAALHSGHPGNPLAEGSGVPVGSGRCPEKMLCGAYVLRPDHHGGAA